MKSLGDIQFSLPRKEGIINVRQPVLNCAYSQFAIFELHIWIIIDSVWRKLRIRLHP